MNVATYIAMYPYIRVMFYVFYVVIFTSLRRVLLWKHS
ncbi:hypothetical protein SXCC_00647 [Gluconacetobacter sp. SXCC-1]|nr:hypothetical protein SXCC_00647 [Gluconacetobacter sp. SXCC-1]